MIFEKVKQIISAKFLIDAEKITIETKLKEDLGIDSLDAVELIMELEEAFGLSIKDSDAANLKSVADIVNYITELSK